MARSQIAMQSAAARGESIALETTNGAIVTGTEDVKGTTEMTTELRSEKDDRGRGHGSETMSASDLTDTVRDPAPESPGGTGREATSVDEMMIAIAGEKIMTMSAQEAQDATRDAAIVAGADRRISEISPGEAALTDA